MKSNNTMPVIFVTVFTGFIGFSLPFPIFSHLFLSPESSLIPALMDDTIRPIYLGIAIALFPIGQAIASPFWGAWSDRYGRKPMLVISLFIASIGMLIVALAILFDLLYLVFLGRLISGLGEGNITIAQSMASDVEDETIKAKYFAAISIAMNAGWIVGPLLGGVLGDSTLTAFTSPSLPFWTAAMMYLINIAIVVILVKETRHRSHYDLFVHNTEQTILWETKAFRAVLLLTLVSFFGTYIMFSFFAPYLVQVFNSTPAEIGVYSALLSVPLIMAGIWSGKVNYWLGLSRVTLMALLLLALGLILLTLPETLGWLIIPATLIAFGIVFLEVNTAILVSEIVPNGNNGKAMGIYRTVIVVAEIIAALAGGYMAGVMPYLPFIIASSVVLLGIPLVGKVLQSGPGKVDYLT